jgi:alcohol dehydrogenase
MQGWGLTVVLGIHATPKMLPLHPMELFDGRRITACVFGDVKGKSQLPAIVDKCVNGVCDISFCRLKIKETKRHADETTSS